VSRTKGAVPVLCVMSWSMVACSGDGLLVGDAQPIVPVRSEAWFSDIAEVGRGQGFASSALSKTTVLGVRDM